MTAFAGSTEFTHPELDGYTGLTWGGQCFTVFSTREAAERAEQALKDILDDSDDAAETVTSFHIVTRDDGKLLIAVIDNYDLTFFFADARGLPGA